MFMILTKFETKCVKKNTVSMSNNIKYSYITYYEPYIIFLNIFWLNELLFIDIYEKIILDDLAVRMITLVIKTLFE